MIPGRCILAVALVAFAVKTTAAEVSVAVASNFSGAMRELAAAFEGETGHELRIAFGASGKFYAQISHGAPFEVFFSADQAKPKALEEAGLAVPGTRRTYAVGALALWSPDPNRVDDEGQVLKTGDFDRLAIANPRLAPYGAAAMDLLRALGLEQTVSKKLVQGENIAQAYQFVASGNADLGLVARSQLTEDGRKGSAWLVPRERYSPIRQDAVLLHNGKDNQAARELMEFLDSTTAHKIIRAHGYQIPPGPSSK